MVDSEGKLCYYHPDGTIEKLSATYVDGSGVTRTQEQITVDEYNAGKTYDAGGYDMKTAYTLKTEDGSAIYKKNMASTATQNSEIGEKTDFGKDSYLPNNDKAVIEEHYDSMAGKDPGVHNAGTSHETTTHVANDVHTFSNPENTKDGNTIVVPQGTKLQWDPSGAPFNGHDFDTSGGSIYLQYSEKDNGYYQVDEYGNRINDQIYSVDGFNTQYGNFN